MNWNKKKQKPELSHFSMEELKEYLDFMVQCGLIEISGFTETGEPRYSITPLGRMELDLQGML